MRKHSGFTLIEMMVAVAVLITLLSAAALGYFSLVSRGTRDAVLSDLSFTLSLARTEAVKRSATVSVCPSADGDACGGTWSDGWLMFVNDDADDPPARDGTAMRFLPHTSFMAIIRLFHTGRSGYTVASTAGIASGVSFRGRGTPTATGTMTVCADDVGVNRQLTLSPIGISKIENGGVCP